VPGLDEILNGGLPAGGNYLLLGQPGTGKTTIGLQFLVEGARHGEKCLYLCMAETHGQLKAMAESFGWIGAAPRDDEVLFWLTDTGAGIAAEDMPHLFDRFWQARKAKRRGAGLGLPIVKGIVEAHGGRIWVESTPGCGSTFYFTIPAAPRAKDWRAEPAPHGA